MIKSMNLLQEKAKQVAMGNVWTAATILKEILHQDILGAIFESPLQEALVFQGGTALRLCHGNGRYSEDLDFVRRRNADGSPVEIKDGDLEAFKRILVSTMRDNYELDIEIKDPKKDLAERSTSERIVVHCWDAKIRVGSPVDSSKQLIRIEVADVPAYDSQPCIVRTPHNLGGSMPIVINASSMAEILCDKLIAVANREYFKARDIWDMQFLKSHSVKFNPEWIRAKAHDYNIDSKKTCPNLKEKLVNRIAALRTEEFVEAYVKEMTRFLDTETAKRYLANPAIVRSSLAAVAAYAEEGLRAVSK